MRNHQDIANEIFPTAITLQSYQTGVATMYVDWTVKNTIFYKEKDWLLPMSHWQKARFVYNLWHEYMHLVQAAQGEPSRLVKEASSSPFPNYSYFSKAEEEAEAFALLMTENTGSTQIYRWNHEDKVRWIFLIKKKIEEKYSLGFNIPTPRWAEEEFEKF